MIMIGLVTTFLSWLDSYAHTCKISVWFWFGDWGIQRTRGDKKSVSSSLFDWACVIAIDHDNKDRKRYGKIGVKRIRKKETISEP
jgi:hypothetical protein